ncbi:MAG: HEPN domain-containing protein [Campylobacterota bacterium]|nr:HEPN domain-containing protein [Campylobacterota bacterium]
MANFQAKEWLRAAYSDLRNIEHIISDSFLTHVVAFHAQQAIEKSFKAIMENSSISVPKVHKLETLVNKINAELEVNFEILATLDLLYIESRYPGDMGLLPHGKPAIKDAEEFYKIAKDIFVQVSQILEITTKELED